MDIVEIALNLKETILRVKEIRNESLVQSVLSISRKEQSSITESEKNFMVAVAMKFFDEFSLKTSNDFWAKIRQLS